MPMARCHRRDKRRRLTRWGKFRRASNEPNRSILILFRHAASRIAAAQNRLREAIPTPMQPDFCASARRAGASESHLSIFYLKVAATRPYGAPSNRFAPARASGRTAKEPVFRNTLSANRFELRLALQVARVRWRLSGSSSPSSGSMSQCCYAFLPCIAAANRKRIPDRSRAADTKYGGCNCLGQMRLSRQTSRQRERLRAAYA